MKENFEHIKKKQRFVNFIGQVKKDLCWRKIF